MFGNNVFQEVAEKIHEIQKEHERICDLVRDRNEEIKGLRAALYLAASKLSELTGK